MCTSIQAIATSYPCSKSTITELALIAKIPLEQAKLTGIQSVHVAEPKTLTTDLAAEAAKKALQKTDVLPQQLDQLVFISEGIGDYLYMDASKTILKKIGGRDDGLIYASDYFRGSNGTVGILRVAGNQLKANPLINCSLVNTSLLWRNHSKNRVLGNTFMGDGAGALILQQDLDFNQILSTALYSMSEYNAVTAYLYGGTAYELPGEAVKTGKFVFDVINKEHLDGIINNVIPASVKVGTEALQKARMTIDDISYIGICGFNKEINEKIVAKFSESKRVIDPIAEKGYIGSLGVFEVLDQFINDDSIQSGETMMLIANGVDVNVEALIIRK